jgi:hypothetical protein
VSAWAEELAAPRPFLIGLSEQRSALVEVVRQHTTAEARILWQDRRGPGQDSCWTALLPVLTATETERAFVGGLDPDAEIEHATGGLVDDTLAGRPLAGWSDADLADYCRSYNIGWVACWHPAALARLGGWAGAEPIATLPPCVEEGMPGKLFRLRRRPSYALAGSVRWRLADTRRIVLADAVPEKLAGEDEGQIVLSLHYQAGMRVSPARVRVERALGSEDSIPFVRLRLSEPVGRIQITWGR